MNLFNSVTGRYVAPEVYRNEEYDIKVDVFSFALILQEVKSLLLTFGCSFFPYFRAFYSLLS